MKISGLRNLLLLIVLSLVLGTTTSCVKQQNSVRGSASPSISTSNEGLSDGEGRVLLDNPIILSNDTELDYSVNLNQYLSSPVFITSNTKLETSCSASSKYCFAVQNDQSTSVFDNGINKWGFDTSDDKFLQTNLYYHLNDIVQNFNSDLQIYARDFGDTSTSDDIDWTYEPLYTFSALPGSIYSSSLFWRKEVDPITSDILPKKLTAYADCSGALNNAFYNPSEFSVCMGFDSVYTEELKFSEDSTIIYHEVGHGLVDMMYNIRNNAYINLTDFIPSAIRAANQETCNFTTQCNTSNTCNVATDEPSTVFADSAGAILQIADGSCYYALASGYFNWAPFSPPTRFTNTFGGTNYEAIAVNEGLADYLSYYINDRTHWGEWALGRYLNLSRPLSEDESIHASGISTVESERLSYPEYIAYNPNNPELNESDVHNTGQIMSHFLTAATRELITNCSIDENSAQRVIMNAVTEALAELGDLTAKGTDDLRSSSDYAINMNRKLAYIWSNDVRPPSFRTFSQSFARHLLNITVLKTNVCKGYSQDKLEKLLDSYGLLLFRKYNADLNNDSLLRPTFDLSVNSLNRVKSELLTKDLLTLDTRVDQPSYIVFDDRSVIREAISNLFNTGFVLPSDIVSDDAKYNNGNSKISPGEVVGIYVNLFNNSNSIIGGARITSSPWAHAENDKPCGNLQDSYPSTSEGAETCSALSKTNFDDDDRYHEVCLLEYKDENATQILTQREFFNKMKTENGFLAKDCIDPSDEKSCFIKSIPGVSSAQFPMINPKSNWLETDQNADGSANYSIRNLIFFEVNKNIPQGTNVVCRLRASFTNCDDCHHDSGRGYDDYYDFEYAGEKPFKIINMSFQVTD